MNSRLNFLCYSEDPKAAQRCQDIARDFQYSYLAVNTTGQLMEMEGKYDLVQFVVVNAATVKHNLEISGLAQVARQFFRDSFICVIAPKKLSPEEAVFVKKSGANMVLLENEFYSTSRLEFIASQVIRASYIPVKVSEFPKDSTLDFTLFHLMPLNQKLIPVLPKGTPLSENRLKKLEGVGEVYVKREEVDKYKHFVETRTEETATSLMSRCRAQYLSLSNSHTQLMFLLIDQSEFTSFKEGKWLYERCEVIARDLVSTLSAVGEAWDIVNNSSLGEFGSVERSPTVAAYAGLLSLLSSVGEPIDVMVAALLADVGMLELDPKITKKLRETQDIEKLNAEELEEYKKHPVFSVNRCLERKFTLKDSIKEAILTSHEKADRSGFPQQRDATKIPMEGMLIQFSEKIDSAAMIRMGQARAPVEEVRKQLLEAEWKSANTFTLPFLQKMKPVI